MKKEVDRDSLVHSRSAKVASEWEQEYLDGEYDGQKRKEPHRNDDRILRKDLGPLQDHLFQILQAQSPENRWYNSNQVEKILGDAIQHARAQRPRIKLLQQSCCDYPMKNTACTNGKQVIDSGQANRVWERGRLWVGKVLCLELDSCEYKKQSKLVVEHIRSMYKRETNQRISCMGCVWDPGGISCSKAQEIWLGTYFPEYKKLIWLVVDQCLGVYALNRGVDDSVCLAFGICFGYKRLFDPGGANCGLEFVAVFAVKGSKVHGCVWRSCRDLVEDYASCISCGNSRQKGARLIEPSSAMRAGILGYNGTSWKTVENIIVEQAERAIPDHESVDLRPPELNHNLEDKVYFSGASNGMSRILVSEAVKKKLRVDKDDAKKVIGDVKLSNVIDGIERLKNIFIGAVMILLALVMEEIEVGFSGGGSGRYVRIGCEDKADVDIGETGIVLRHISQRRCYKKVHITMLEYLLDMRQQILEELRTESFEATMERSRADAGRETEAEGDLWAEGDLCC
ncbi:unnamed protein product [Arabis nemorensis]|uniref:Uncharacterized protein n=1 Tax=Arabis nemorensis TaxID=586526 RepID=A0A565BUS4_9BRAS|nr:unnamed protein product [Arabis nemorensis]